MVTDTAGATASTLTYVPHGSNRSSTGTVPTERKFTGQRLDGGTGLYFYGARYYDAGLGRFVSGDGIVPGLGNSQAWNRYSYVVNNPLRYMDPTGQWHRPDDELRVAFIDSPDPALPTEDEIGLYERIKKEHGWAIAFNLPHTEAVARAVTDAVNVDYREATEPFAELPSGAAVVTPYGDTMHRWGSDDTSIDLTLTTAVGTEIDFSMQKAQVFWDVPPLGRAAWTRPGTEDVHTLSLPSRASIGLVSHEVEHVRQRADYGVFYPIAYFISGGPWGPMENVPRPGRYVVIFR